MTEDLSLVIFIRWRPCRASYNTGKLDMVPTLLFRAEVAWQVDDPPHGGS